MQRTLARTSVLAATTMSAPNSMSFSERCIDTDDFIEVLCLGHQLMQVIKSGSEKVQWNVKAAEWWKVYYQRFA